MRASLVTAAAALSLFQPIQAELHQLFAGTYSSDFIYTIEFDDEAKSLSLLKNNSAKAGSSWITLSVSYNSGLSGAKHSHVLGM